MVNSRAVGARASANPALQPDGDELGKQLIGLTEMTPSDDKSRGLKMPSTASREATHQDLVRMFVVVFSPLGAEANCLTEFGHTSRILFVCIEPPDHL